MNAVPVVSSVMAYAIGSVKSSEIIGCADYRVLASTVSLTVLLAFIFYQRILSPLANVPGPFLATWTNLYWVRIARADDTHLVTVALHAKYGDVVRIAPNSVYVSQYQILASEAFMVTKSSA